MIACEHCNSTNQDGLDACKNCGSPLPRAEESGTCNNSASQPASNAETCRCISPELDEGTSQCMFCGGVVTQECENEDVGSPPKSSIESAFSSQPESQREVTVILPGPTSIPVGNGLLLGRDRASVPNSVARILAEYPGVSKRHVWIGCHQDALLLIDLNSLNGTRINGQCLIPYTLHTIPLRSENICLQLGKALEISIDAGEHQ